MRKLTKLLTISVMFAGITNTCNVFGRETKRSSKISKASNYKASTGLRVNTPVESNDKETECGQNATLNATKSACECIDPTNYVLDTINPTQCYQKTDPIVIAQKKACGNVLINAINKICDTSKYNNGLSDDGSIKCYEANDLFLKFDTSSLTVYINGEKYPYDKVCYVYTEDLEKSIAEEYSITGLNSPNCKLKRVIADASNECFQAVLSTGKAFGATKAIYSDLQKICGTSGLHSKWNQLFGDDDNSGLNFPTNIPDLYLKAGKLSSANGIELVGNMLDGKITDKSNTWEVNLTQILNSHLNDVGLACGKEYTPTLHNTNLQLDNNKSSLQKQIDEKGSIKGANDWAMMQASVIIGEDKANKLIKKGVVNNTSDEADSEIPITLTEITDIEPENITFEKFSSEGRYLIYNDKEYTIIDIKKNTAGGDILEYENIPYNNELNLSNEALKIIIGKESKTLPNSKVIKE